MKKEIENVMYALNLGFFSIDDIYETGNWEFNQDINENVTIISRKGNEGIDLTENELEKVKNGLQFLDNLSNCNDPNPQNLYSILEKLDESEKIIVLTIFAKNQKS